MQDFIGQLRQVNVKIDHKTKTFELLVGEELFLSWRMAMHLCVLEVVRELIALKCDLATVAETTQGIHVSSNGDEQLRLERRGFKQLELSDNHTWVISFVRFTVRFPYGYDFAACLAEVKNLNKWRKLVHGVVKKPFTVESTLPPDLLIKVKAVHIQIDDDPFEVKLGDNYK
ncbi:hypothetical protein LSH36_71g02022, partial [Paralvinella palmiformis]